MLWSIIIIIILIVIRLKIMTKVILIINALEYNNNCNKNE